VDFFAAQEFRRKKTKWLVLLYVVAVLAIIAGIYVVIAIALGVSDESPSAIFNPLLFAAVAVVTTLIIGLGSLSKIFELRSGGQAIAAQMGGTRVPASTSEYHERVLLNVVEEMALASGISVPPVYILNDEPGINAFAAGYSPADAVIGVNRGTVETLSRDELQGVIAHEFSHILNGDMRMNIRLIGILFGIQMLAVTGYFLLRTMGTGSRRRSGGDNKGAGAILAIALAFLVFGSIGQFFARLIKASISRQREYLADASAVQFTRYPDGIGGALKMIGATGAGSVVQAGEAEQLSHMFFANCFKSNMVSLLATHPPLVPRIQKLDKNFDGDFAGYLGVRERIAKARQERREQEKQARESSFSPLSKMFPQEIMERFSIDPAFLLAAIGSPDSQDVKRSKALIEGLPQNLLDAAHHPYSARCVAFAFLVSEDSTLRYEQMNLLRRNEGEATVETTTKLLETALELKLRVRLPVMEMIQGSLSDLSPQQYVQFRQTVEQLVRLDRKTSLFEFIVRHHLLMHLDRRFELQKPTRVRFKQTSELAREIELMLSAFASASVTGSVLEEAEEPEPEVVLASYRLAMQVAGFGESADSTAELKSWEVEQLETAMRSLQLASPEVKKQFLQAAAVLITYDHEITITEAEFFRAVAESLDCPVPLFAAGRTTRTDVAE
jgi:Zn-dependent protease with chaperone function